ncbi:MAG: hypothetical protein J5589_07075 [Firmicutes bacterium]|nr:hypothetical protein [Bacillota bacterium]
MYHVALDENEHGILIRCLNDERTSLLNEGHTTDALDDLIVKVGTARQKKCRVTEKGRTHDAR